MLRSVADMVKATLVLVLGLLVLAAAERRAIAKLQGVSLVASRVHDEQASAR